MKGGVEGFAAATLREWLLLKLPAVVDACNLTRAAFLKSPWAGPWVIGAGKTLGICLAPGSNVFTDVPLTAGTRTAAQLAADVELVIPGIASADSAGRLLLTSTSAPTTSTSSSMRLRGGTTTDVNALLGWNPGGEKNVTTALVAPSAHNVCDGLPILNEFSNTLGKGSIVVIIDDRSCVPTGNKGPREDHFIVTLGLVIIRTEPEQANNSNHEHIEACVECVRTALSTNAGRQLGRAGVGDVGLVMFGPTKVFGELGVYANKKLVSPLASYASMQLQIRMYERPTA